MPAAMNKLALHRACCMRWVWESSACCAPSPAISSPMWLLVDRAMVFLRSCCVVARRAEYVEVVRPTHSSMLE